MSVGHARRLAHIRKCSIAVVSIEQVGTQAGEVNVRNPVVIVVSDRASAVPAGSSQVRPRGDIRKCPVTVVPQEVVVRAHAPRLRFSRGTVGQKNVRVAVVIVVEETRALAIHIGQVFRHLIAVDDRHGEPGFSRDIRKGR